MAGNTLGRDFTVTSFCESHGPAIGCVVDGCPPGLALTAEDIQLDLDRRKPGTSRHVTQRQESDRVEILSGVFEGNTTGTPIALLIRNEDQRSRDYGNLIDTFRPGHADYTYWQKYGIRDPRGGGRSSARETTMRVAAAVVAKRWLRERYGIRVQGWLSGLGPYAPQRIERATVEDNPLFWPDPDQVAEIEAFMDGLRKSGDSIGARLTVVELNPALAGEADGYRVTLDATELESCDKVVSTSTLLLNDTLDRMLGHCRQARWFAMVGPGAGCLPDALFARGVTLIGGNRIDDGPGFIEALRRGESTSRYSTKSALTPDSYPGFAALLERAKIA